MDVMQSSLHRTEKGYPINVQNTDQVSVIDRLLKDQD